MEQLKSYKKMISNKVSLASDAILRVSNVGNDITAKVYCGAEITFVCRDGICYDDCGNSVTLQEFIDEFKESDMEEMSGVCLIVDNLTKFYLDNQVFIESNFDDINIDKIGLLYRKINLFFAGRLLALYSLDIMDLTNLNNKDAIEQFNAYARLLARCTSVKHASGYRLPGTLAGITGKILSSSRCSRSKSVVGSRAVAKTKEEYLLQRQFFHGGLQVGNTDNVRKTIKTECTCYDMTSAYIYSMVANLYPSGTMFNLDLQGPALKFSSVVDLVNQLHKRNVLKDSIRLYYVKFGILSQKTECKVPYLSKNWVDKFGSIITGEFNYSLLMGTDIYMYLTEPDLEMVFKSYNVVGAEMLSCYFYNSTVYMPTYITEVIYKLYNEKKKLKGIPSKKAEYKATKVLLNSIYGKIAQRREGMIDAGTISSGVAPFIWGVFITAYQRKLLYESILKFGDNFIFANTDCIWAKDTSTNEHIIEGLNESIHSKLVKLNGIADRPSDWCRVFDDLGSFVPEHYTNKLFVLTPSRYYMSERDSKDYSYKAKDVFKCSGLEYADDCMKYLVESNNVFSGYDIMKAIVAGVEFHIPAEVARVRHVEIVKDTSYTEELRGYDLGLKPGTDYFRNVAKKVLRRSEDSITGIDKACDEVLSLPMSDILYNPT